MLTEMSTRYVLQIGKGRYMMVCWLEEDFERLLVE
jgi:hypothetical protein